MMVLDGSFGEGGGQILRTALALSCVTGRPFRIERIRANRSNPGLAPQHLACVRAAREIALADVEGDRLAATELTFRPRAVRCGRYEWKIPTAGAATLVLQTVLAPLSLASGKSTIEITGGTHVPWSPCFEYVRHVYLPVVGKAGLRCRIELAKAGYYPKGGGRLRAEVLPRADAPPLSMERRGDMISLFAMASTSGLPASIAQRECERARELLGHHGIALEQFVVEERESRSPGNVFGLVAEAAGGRAGSFALGEKGVPAEKIAARAVREMLAYLGSGCAVDAHLADQLVTPLAAFDATAQYSTPEVTEHLRTNVEVVRAFLPGRVHLEGARDAPGMVTVTPR